MVKRTFDIKSWKWNTLARIHDRLVADGVIAYECGEYELARAFQLQAQLTLQLLQRLTSGRRRR